MRQRLEGGQYASWDDLSADLELMFGNALRYNPQGDAVWTYAGRLRAAAAALLTAARAGRASFRGAAAGAARKVSPRAAGSAALVCMGLRPLRLQLTSLTAGLCSGKCAQAAAEARAAARAERDALRAQARAEQRAAQEAKVLKRAGVAGGQAEGEDENARRSFTAPAPAEPRGAGWGALAGGASAEGVPLGPGRFALRPTNAAPSAAAYAASLARFGAGLVGRVRELVMGRAAAAAAADAAFAPPQQQSTLTMARNAQLQAASLGLAGGGFALGAGGGGLHLPPAPGGPAALLMGQAPAPAAPTLAIAQLHTLSPG